MKIKFKTGFKKTSWTVALTAMMMGGALAHGHDKGAQEGLKWGTEIQQVQGEGWRSVSVSTHEKLAGWLEPSSHGLKVTLVGIEQTKTLEDNANSVAIYKPKAKECLIMMTVKSEAHVHQGLSAELAKKHGLKLSEKEKEMLLEFEVLHEQAHCFQSHEDIKFGKGVALKTLDKTPQEWQEIVQGNADLGRLWMESYADLRAAMTLLKRHASGSSAEQIRAMKTIKIMADLREKEIQERGGVEKVRIENASYATFSPLRSVLNEKSQWMLKDVAQEAWRRSVEHAIKTVEQNQDAGIVKFEIYSGQKTVYQTIQAVVESLKSEDFKSEDSLRKGLIHSMKTIDSRTLENAGGIKDLLEDPKVLETILRAGKDSGVLERKSASLGWVSSVTLALEEMAKEEASSKGWKAAYDENRLKKMGDWLSKVEVGNPQEDAVWGVKLNPNLDDELMTTQEASEQLESLSNLVQKLEKRGSPHDDSQEKTINKLKL